MRVLCAILILTATLLHATDAEPVPAPKAVAAAEVERLVKQLADEDFATREAATQALVTLGSGVLPHLEKALAGNTDPEVSHRAAFIREEIEIEAVANLEAGGKAYVRLAEKLVQSRGQDAQLEGRMQALAKRLKEMAEKEGNGSELAGAHHQAGMRFYAAFRAGHANKHVLSSAARELDRAVVLYEKHLEKHPGDKATEEQQVQANMIMYACRKYSELGR